MIKGLPYFLDEFNSIDGSIYVVRVWDVIISLSLFFSITFYLVPRVLDKGNIKKFIVMALGLLFLLCLLELLLDWLVIFTFNLPFGEDQISDKALQYKDVRRIDSNILPGNLILFGISILYGLSRDWVVKFRHRQLRKQDKLQAELDFLRSQINPHFLFNTLNSIYATSLKKERIRTSEAILSLSGMMRYMLEENQSETWIKDEINHIQNFIDLVILRFNDDDPLEIQFTHKLEYEDIKIAPLILIPFVENAVKHGISAEGIGKIDINFIADEKEILFSVINTVNEVNSNIKSGHGIGLKNVKRRLELLYPQSHQLSIEKSDHLYKVELKIQWRIN